MTKRTWFWQLEVGMMYALISMIAWPLLHQIFIARNLTFDQQHNLTSDHYFMFHSSRAFYQYNCATISHRCRCWFYKKWEVITPDWKFLSKFQSSRKFGSFFICTLSVWTLAYRTVCLRVQSGSLQEINSTILLPF